MKTLAGLMWWWLGLGVGSFVIMYIATRPLRRLTTPFMREEISRGMPRKEASRLAHQRYSRVLNSSPVRKLLAEISGGLTIVFALLFLFSFVARMYS